MLCQPKSPELPSAEATWLRARRAAGLPERTGLPLRSRWRNGSRFSAREWNAWSALRAVLKGSAPLRRGVCELLRVDYEWLGTCNYSFARCVGE